MPHCGDGVSWAGAATTGTIQHIHCPVQQPHGDQDNILAETAAVSMGFLNTLSTVLLPSREAKGLLSLFAAQHLVCLLLTNLC